jgi:hypothetical protein
MAAERALAVPFEAGEIIDILCQEFRTRLGANCTLQGRREYASFKASFDVKMTLRTVAGEAVETIVWAKPYRDEKVEGTTGAQTITVEPPVSEYASGEPNAERMRRGMPLTVTDKRGNKRKVRVSDAEAVSAQPKASEVE